MDFTLQIMVGLVTAMLGGLGVMSMFAPQRMVGNFSLQPIGSSGLNTVRSVIGGLFLACVTMLVLALYSGDTEGYFFVAIVMITVAIGRVVGVVLDGFDRAIVPPLILELVIASILLYGHFKSGGFY